MTQRFTVHFDGPDTHITPDLDGPCPRWEMARLAAIEHLRDHVTECERTLSALRRAGCFFVYEVLMEEMEAMDS